MVVELMIAMFQRVVRIKWDNTYEVLVESELLWSPGDYGIPGIHFGYCSIKAAGSHWYTGWLENKEGSGISANGSYYSGRKPSLGLRPPSAFLCSNTTLLFPGFASITVCNHSRPWRSLFLLLRFRFSLFLIEIYLTHNVTLVSGGQRRDSTGLTLCCAHGKRSHYFSPRNAITIPLTLFLMLSLWSPWLSHFIQILHLYKEKAVTILLRSLSFKYVCFSITYHGKNLEVYL